MAFVSVVFNWGDNATSRVNAIQLNECEGLEQSTRFRCICLNRQQLPETRKQSAKKPF